MFVSDCESISATSYIGNSKRDLFAYSKQRNILEIQSVLSPSK